MRRRDFIYHSAFLGAGLSLVPSELFAADYKKITVLHTNDVHSRIEPFPLDDKYYPGQGGFARRAALVNKIRQQEKNVVLLDSGDIFQGTPYFNYFGGELEFKLMSEMGYDAATLGNHDFDAGLEGLNKQLPHATFPFVSANYDFSDTIMAEKIEKFTIIEREGIKIGIFGLGIELEGLVPKKLYGQTRYSDPVKEANKLALFLKSKEECHVIICLSHLGYYYNSNKISDMELAVQTKNIDLILGGHTHTFMEAPMIIENIDNEQVVINQVGWAGVLLGKIDIFVSKKSEKKEFFSQTVKVR
ncbi:MAG: metallophosphatase [Chitinophagales bacterium]